MVVFPSWLRLLSVFGWEVLISCLQPGLALSLLTQINRPLGEDESVMGSQLTVEVHAEDYHRVVEAVDMGPVDAFGSSA